MQKAAALPQQLRRKKMRMLLEKGADFACIQQFEPDDQVPIRQYYHSRAHLPMIQGDWDEDSDDEPLDDDWLQKMSNKVCRGRISSPFVKFVLQSHFECCLLYDGLY